MPSPSHDEPFGAYLPPSWNAAMRGRFSCEAFAKLLDFTKSERMSHTVFPPENKVFRAFNAVPFDKVRVVIIGQDPYHGPGQACGLAFSVPPGVRKPPSLRNIYKELSSEFPGFDAERNGDLAKWAEQGVLLMNATLTVKEGLPGSHRGKGWEEFTDSCIKALSDLRSGIVFLLWGAYAQKKADIIDASRHLILCAPHPSPLSARRGFFGCGHFKSANEYLAGHGEKEIEW